MIVGNKVRIHDTKTERTGTVIQINGDDVLVGVGEPHYFNYEEKTFPRRQLSVLTELSMEDFDKWVNENLPTVYERAKEVFAKMLPDVTLNFRPHTRMSDGCIEAYGMGITLDPCIVEIRSIGRIREIGGYTVSRWHYDSGDYNTPPESDQEELGQFSHANSAIFRFAEAVFGEKVSGWFYAQADNEYAQSLIEEKQWIQ